MFSHSRWRYGQCCVGCDACGPHLRTCRRDDRLAIVALLISRRLVVNLSPEGGRSAQPKSGALSRAVDTRSTLDHFTTREGAVVLDMYTPHHLTHRSIPTAQISGLSFSLLVPAGDFGLPMRREFCGSMAKPKRQRQSSCQ